MIFRRKHGLRKAATIGRRIRAASFLTAFSIFGAAMGHSGAKAESSPVRIPASKPFTAASVSLTGDLDRPEGTGHFPAVVLMHGCGGLQSAVRHGLGQHATFLRKHGFVVLTLDSFGPRGNAGGAVCSSFDRLREARDYRTHDAFDALRFLQAQDFVDPARIFLVGQSNGGSVALNAAAAGAAKRYNRGARGFAGVVAYYPWCGTLGTTRLSLEAPLMVFGGGRDDWVPADQCGRFRATGASLAVKIYPTAAHSFDLLAPEHRYLGKLVGYDRAATEDSRQRMLAFFTGDPSDSPEPTDPAYPRNLGRNDAALGGWPAVNASLRLTSGGALGANWGRD